MRGRSFDKKFVDLSWGTKLSTTSIRREGEDENNDENDNRVDLEHDSQNDELSDLGELYSRNQ